MLRLAILEEETTDFEPMLELLLTLAIEQGRSTFVTGTEVDINREGLP